MPIEASIRAYRGRRPRDTNNNDRGPASSGATKPNSQVNIGPLDGCAVKPPADRAVIEGERWIVACRGRDKYEWW